MNATFFSFLVLMTAHFDSIFVWMKLMWATLKFGIKKIKIKNLNFIIEIEIKYLFKKMLGYY
jgi:hypothetical protein